MTKLQKCLKCKVRLTMWVDPFIYDGPCAMYCEKCGYIKVIDRFAHFKERIIEELSNIIKE